MSFQKFLKSLLHSLEASLSALRISAFFSHSLVAFKMSASNFHYIIQGTMMQTPSRTPEEKGFSSSLMGVSDLIVTCDVGHEYCYRLLGHSRHMVGCNGDAHLHDTYDRLT